MEIIVAMIIAVSGWVVTHILTIRAQNKAFLNQVLNQARIDIMGTLRDYQDWLSEVSNAICSISGDLVLWEGGISNGGPLHWLKKHAQFSRLFFSDKRSSEWNFRLVEYQILFPKTAKCLGDLGNRNIEITKYLSSFLDKLPSGVEKPSELEQRKKAIAKTQKELTIVTEQSALMYDLQNYLQNFCFGVLTGNKIPERRPAKGFLRLAEDKDGNLQVIIERGEELSGSGRG
jgi:hypothetical protein